MYQNHQINGMVVTYQEDKEVVVKAISELKGVGKYPTLLWEEGYE